MDVDEHKVLAATRPFTRADDRVAWFQVLTSLALTALAFGLVARAGPLWGLLAMPLVVASLIRLFVLNHDIGHHSLFASAKVNDAWGTLISFILGVPYEAWRAEHDWHHQNQGKLSHRGVDRMNSPMTSSEALERPADAELRQQKISPLYILVAGSISLAILRKHKSGFFQYRPKFRWPFHGRERVERGIKVTLIGYALFQLLLLLLLGWVSWLVIVVPGYLIAAALGSYLFWVQHNFEPTFHAEDEVWSYVAVALRGSSYLALPQPLAWITANIGLHHVHHLNPRIPNYRLEEARLAIDELRAVPRLTRTDIRRSFTHVFWDERRARMVTLQDVRESATEDSASAA